MDPYFWLTHPLSSPLLNPPFSTQGVSPVSFYHTCVLLPVIIEIFS